MDKRARLTTVISIAVLLGILGLVWRFGGEGGYGVAWFISLAVAVLLLFVLSIPRSIKATGHSLDIICVVEITHIPLSDIRGIRRVMRSEANGMPCLLGSWGFFGYFGVYLDLKRFRTVRFYCTRLDNFVEITDIRGRQIYVSPLYPDELVSFVTEAMRQSA